MISLSNTHVFSSTEDIPKDKLKPLSSSFDAEGFIAKNPHLKDILYAISLYNSEVIPLKILDLTQDMITVHNLINELQSAQIITVDRSSDKITAVTIDPVVQKAIVAVVKPSLTFANELNNNIVQVFSHYMSECLEQQSLEPMKNLEKHYKSLIEFKNILYPKKKFGLKAHYGLLKFLLQDEVNGRLVTQKSVNKLERFEMIHSDWYADARYDLGIMDEHQHNYKDAQTNFEQALKHYSVRNNQIHLQGRIQKHLGKIYQKLCLFNDARHAIEQASSIFDKTFRDHFKKQSKSNDLNDTFNPDLKEIYACRRVKVAIEENAGNYWEAEALLKDCEDYFSKGPGKNHHDYVWTRLHQGHIHLKLNKIDKAQPYYEEAVDILKTLYSEDAIIHAWASLHLANYYRIVKRFDDAKRIYDKALTVYKTIYKDDHVCMAWVQQHRARLLRDEGELNTAITQLLNSRDIFEKVYGKNHLRTSYIYRDLGEAYLQTFQWNEARKCVRKALTITDNHDHTESYINHLLLAEISKQESIEHLLKANAIACFSNLKNDPLIRKDIKKKVEKLRKL